MKNRASACPAKICWLAPFKVRLGIGRLYVSGTGRPEAPLDFERAFLNNRGELDATTFGCERGDVNLRGRVPGIDVTALRNVLGTFRKSRHDSQIPSLFLRFLVNHFELNTQTKRNRVAWPGRTRAYKKFSLGFILFLNLELCAHFVFCYDRAQPKLIPH